MFGYLTTGFDNFVVAPGRPCMGQALKNARVSTRQDYFGSLILILCLNVQKARFYEPFLQCSNAATESSQPYQLDGEKEGWLFLFPFLCLFPKTTWDELKVAGTK